MKKFNYTLITYLNAFLVPNVEYCEMTYEVEPVTETEIESESESEGYKPNSWDSKMEKYLKHKQLSSNRKIY